MRLLALDTAGPSCAAAVARAEGEAAHILARASERIGRGHAERLMPMIESVLAAAGIGFADLGRIAVATGPGSFTGVRVGVAAARGLALALGIPAVGVGSLTALARPIVGTERAGTAVVALDARRDDVWLLATDLATGAQVIPACAASLATLTARLAALPRPLVLTGAGAPLVADRLKGADFRVAGTDETPDIADIAALGLRAEQGGPPLPVYARGADAKPQLGKSVARV